VALHKPGRETHPPRDAGVSVSSPLGAIMTFGSLYEMTVVVEPSDRCITIDNLDAPEILGKSKPK
jgi:hypothetical protein